MAESHHHSASGEVKAAPKHTIKEPSLFHVILLNDDYTTMDFVIEVLRRVFHKTQEEATRIMFDVHKKGKGICGTYVFDIARTKVRDVQRLAKEQSFPLRCEYQEAPK